MRESGEGAEFLFAAEEGTLRKTITTKGTRVHEGKTSKSFTTESTELHRESKPQRLKPHSSTFFGTTEVVPFPKATKVHEEETSKSFTTESTELHRES